MTQADDGDGKEAGFLGRWSRRKLQPEVPAPLPVSAPPSPAATPTEHDARPRDPETGELIDEELVNRLPAVSELQAGGDLSAFMQKGVPEALRREALRTMWLKDPVIRNYVSPALDYAYDYNAPGGAPGFGPLSESDVADARTFLAKVFSTPQDQAGSTEVAGKTGSCDKQPHNEAADGSASVRQSDAAPQQFEENDAAADTVEAVKQAYNNHVLPETDEVSVVQRSIHSRDAARMTTHKRRRGGGAAPVLR